MRRRQVLFSMVLVVLLTLLVSGIASGKGHVPVNQVQVCHKGVARAVDAPALAAHLRHGDIRLPACDFDNVFFEGGDCSNVTDNNVAGLADLPAPGAVDVGGPGIQGSSCNLTPACPLAGPGGPKPPGCF